MNFRINHFLLQIVEAKVHQLDYALERITLSLKEIVVLRVSFPSCSMVHKMFVVGGIFFSWAFWQPDLLMPWNL